jgi:SPW repeat
MTTAHNPSEVAPGEIAAPRHPDPASKARHDSILEIYNLVLAVFVFASPWLFAYVSRPARLELWMTSIAIAVLSFAAIIAFAEWEEWLSLLLALWLVAAPWVLGFAHTTAMHVSVTAGIIIAFLAGLDLWLEHYRPSSDGA